MFLRSEMVRYVFVVADKLCVEGQDLGVRLVGWLVEHVVAA